MSGFAVAPQQGNVSEDEIRPGPAPGQVTDDRDCDAWLQNESDPHIIEVHCLFTFADVCENEAWGYLDLALSVTQNYAKDPADTSPQPNNCAQIMQQKVENGGVDGKHLVEAFIRIVINKDRLAPKRHYKFQLFVRATEDSAERLAINCMWSKLEACVFVGYPASGQPLRPITRTILRSTAISTFGDSFLGSFAFDGGELFHVDPSEAALKRRDDSNASVVMQEPVNFGPEAVKHPEVDEIIVEPRKARGGRPRYKYTSEQLMTTPQVYKVLEMRERWRGLKERQRKMHINAEDLYCFFTLNRDETARCLDVCATWLKDVLRDHGIRVWPQRPLRKSGADLEEYKRILANKEASLPFTNEGDVRTGLSAEINELKRHIQQLLQERLKIVEKNVDPDFFRAYCEAKGYQHLNPTWDAVPPASASQPFTQNVP